MLAQAVQFLAAGWDGRSALDLSGTLVVVPTRQSGRRLREALASLTAAAGTAAFAPRVITPESLVFDRAADPGAASRLESLLAWTDVLQSIDLTQFATVFPVPPPMRNFAWALRLGEQLLRLQSTLEENGLLIRDVAARAGAGFPETARWSELAELERRQHARLRQAGRQLRAASSEGSESPPAGFGGVGRVVLVGVPDPVPSAIALLARWAERMPVDVVVFAPETEAKGFDDWGRPLSAYWANQPIELPPLDQGVWVCGDPAAQAQRIVALSAAYRSGGRTPDEVLALGITDPEVTEALEIEAAAAGVTVFNPEGEVRRHTGVHQLIAAFFEAAQSPSFEAVEVLARCPDLLRHLRYTLGSSFDVAGFLHGLDELHRRHLPGDPNVALAYARGPVADGLAAITQLLERLRRGVFPDAVLGALAEIFAERELLPGDPRDDALADAAAAFAAFAGELRDASVRFPGLAPAEQWELALRLFGESRRPAEKPAGALEAQGWLELLYEDAPHLVLAGCNDGRVPEAVSDDPFLPDSLRQRLGLKSNAGRLARDAYVLSAILASRRGERGRVDLLIGRTSAAGDPLRPSRLLFRCADEELPERVARLFAPVSSEEAQLPWTRAWRLRPRRVPVPTKVAVTALRRWLRCPLRFYLQYALRMEAVDAAKSEMDAFDFGTLCHAALEAMGRHPDLRETTDASLLREFLLAELDQQSRAKFGGALTLPLLVQLESARQRLSKLAEVQARERADGWLIVEVERPFSVQIAGLTVNGKIDRIDRHEATGAVRVLDYKTSDTAVNPRSAHLRPVRAEDALPEWATVVVDGKPRAWADLQLPLYRHALAPEFGNAIACGYINLPKAAGQTALALWEDGSLDLQAAALRCAEGVCDAIVRGEFWPPNEGIRPEDDDFVGLFHHGVAASVEWSGNLPSA